MKELGIPDSEEQSKSYIKHCLGDLYEETRMSAFLETGPAMVKWMEKNTSMRWVGIPAPDYHMDIEGATYGRTLMTKPFDGRLLGSLVRDVRYPLQGMCAFGSMQTDLLDVNKWKSPFGSWSNFKFCTRNLARWGYDRIRYGKGTALYNGNALAAATLLCRHGWSHVVESFSSP